MTVENYAIEHGSLVIHSPDGYTRSVRPEGIDVVECVQVEEGRYVVVLDWGAGSKRLANLVKIDRDGSIIWRAEPPTDVAADVFVGVANDAHGHVIATTWSGFQAGVDTATGSARLGDFTK